MRINVGIVGATGLVGEVFLKLLEERKFPTSEVRLYASEASAGSTLRFMSREIPIKTLSTDCFKGLDLVFFSSGDSISRDWAPRAAQAGAWAIDNSAAFRMDPAVPLVVPEVNFSVIEEGQNKIIANPNCTTIQMVVALKPLDSKFKLKRVQVASYQAVSGAGKAAQQELISQLQQELAGNQASETSAFPHVIAFNCIPQIGSFDDSGQCTEEIKVQNETRKILNLPHLAVSATTVRVPSLNAHSEAIWLEFEKDTTVEEIRKTLQQSPGVVVMDEPQHSRYPTARMAAGQDAVYVGRIHKDPTWPKCFKMWIVADNLRKGAALNGIQIAERLFGLNS